MLHFFARKHFRPKEALDLLPPSSLDRLSSLVLQLSRVAFGYDGAQLLHDITFTLKRGQIGCLLGPSGCGKTTLLRLIAGFEIPCEGEILINGEVASTPLGAVPPEHRGVGIVFQDYALFPHLSVAQNIAFGLHQLNRQARQQQTQKMLDLVGLAPFRDRYPHELSGGQQQRVAIARALAPDPNLILLDEPFSNLDQEMRDQLGSELRTLLNGFGTTALLVTHNQEEAFSFADLVGVLAHGHIQQWDCAYNLYHHPCNRLVADFIGTGVLMPGRGLHGKKVVVELGVLDCEISAADISGCDLEILLRPDDIILDPHGQIRAYVEKKSFHGAEFLYTLRLPSGFQLLSLMPSHCNVAVGESTGIRLAHNTVLGFKKPLSPGATNP